MITENDKILRRFVALALVLDVIIADQITKWLMLVHFFGDGTPDLLTWLFSAAPQLEFASHRVTSFLNLVMVWNPGISFGFLQTGHGWMAHALSALAVLVAGGFLVWMWRYPTRLRVAAVALIAGGALGNVWDRLRFGAVADFIDFHVAGYHWPAFNVADAAVCTGVALLLVETLFFGPQNVIGEKNK